MSYERLERTPETQTRPKEKGAFPHAHERSGAITNYSALLGASEKQLEGLDQALGTFRATVMRRVNGGRGGAVNPGAVFDAATAGAPGALPYKAEMERGYGADFSSVRSYTGQGAQMDAIGASAAARGDQVVFADDAPDRHTVAHELAHVMQARNGASAIAAYGGLGAPHSAAEREAERAADTIVGGGRVGRITERVDGIHREPKHSPGGPAGPASPTIDVLASALGLAEHASGRTAAQAVKTRLEETGHQRDWRRVCKHAVQAFGETAQVLQEAGTGAVDLASIGQRLRGLLSPAEVDVVIVDALWQAEMGETLLDGVERVLPAPSVTENVEEGAGGTALGVGSSAAAAGARQTSVVELIKMRLAEGGESARMAADFKKVSDSTEEHIHINTPGYLAGLGWNKTVMAPWFAEAKAGYEVHVKAAFERYKVDGTDTSRAAVDAAIAEFEKDHGKRVRQGVADYWARLPAGAPERLAATATEAGSLADELERARGQKLVSAEMFKSIPDTLAAQMQNLETLSTTDYSMGSKTMKEALAGTFTAFRKAADSLKQLSRKSQVGQKQLRLATKKIRAGSAALSKLAAKAKEHSRFAARALNVDELPLLQVVDRRTVKWRFKTDSQGTFKDKPNHRFAAYTETFHGTPRPLPAKGKGNKDGKKNGHEARIERIKKTVVDLRAQGVGESNSKMIAAVSGAEGKFDSVQAIDRVRFTWGMIQFATGHLVGVLKRIKDSQRAVWEEYFAPYGIAIGRPKGQTDPTRDEREKPGQERGRATKEAAARDVRDLWVFDHAAKVWVQGNEGLAVIQKDPRYQMLFAAAGRTQGARVAQMTYGDAKYAKPWWSRSFKVKFAGDKKPSKIAYKACFRSEVAMFPMVHGAISGSGHANAIKALKKYATTHGLNADTIEAHLASASAQAELAELVKKHTQREVRWKTMQWASEAGYPLDDTTYKP